MASKKLKTNIDGLDDLLYGGLHLYPKKENEEQTGTVIAIRGEDAAHKLQFSMQLMCGIYKSLWEKENKEGKNKEMDKPQFHSLSIGDVPLNDLCLDFQICNAVYRFLHEYQKSNSSFNPCIYWEKNGKGENGKGENEIKEDEKKIINKKLKDDYYYYNPRTSCVHFRRYGNEGDGDDNIAYKRRFNKIHDFFDQQNDASNVESGLINVHIDGCDGNVAPPEDDNNQSGQGSSEDKRRSPKPFVKFLDILNWLSKTEKISCIVIHGFSQLTSDELKRLPIHFLVDQLRKKAIVSILVFDERGEDLHFNADMFINMRRNDKKYLFYEMKICETSHQVAALGWHQYKLRDYGIEVFPSIHRIIQRRYYMSSSIDYVASKPMTDIPYDEFLTRKYIDNPLKIEDYTVKVSQDNYDCWEGSKQDKTLNQVTTTTVEIPFNKILVDKPPVDKIGDLTNIQLIRRRRKITALIGKPNTFKRLFANARAYYNSRVNKEHTLIILFDKDPFDYRQKLTCPMKRQCQKYQECQKCAEGLHLLSIRTGGISPDELFYKIQTVLKWDYRSMDSEKEATKIKHIIIDDLQKIDFSFPFLKEESLFLPALITMCKDKNIGVQFLCDKQSSMAEALCALADEVISFERDYADSVKLTVERSPEFNEDSMIKSYNITNARDYTNWRTKDLDC